MELDPAIVLIVGALIPLLVSVVNRYKWDAAVKALVDLVLVIAVGVLVAWLTDHWDKNGIIQTCAAIYVIAQVTLQSVWKPTGTTEQIEKSTG